MRTLLLLLLAAISFSLQAQPIFNLELINDDLSQPADITNAGDDRLFVVERAGRIRILDADGQLLPEPFLDINDRVGPANGERGLLGLAFHPNYADNGYFFVNYTANDGDTRIARFQVNAGNPNTGDPNSEVILFDIGQPYGNHNAGDLAFGPDGYLYIPMGDGGSGGDPQNFSQNRQSLLGKMLRIDVDNGNPYAIPPDNPYAEDDFTLDEVWAIGLRNPWRFSFDRETGDIWIGDVGQNEWEEITFQPADSEGGENYGWRCYEGFEAYNTGGCEPESAYTPPIHTYNTGSSDGCSVTGGFVYRGSAFPALYGKYVYADFCSGKIWTLEQDFAGNWVNTEVFDGPGGEYA
ncbi:PQQ-dependent sugar dehydrogenase, partial [Phaeodactylibacter xiamenensis]|uniref:PQQ-dependent sugar dehydrogenase n=1 Tax=Phaeodactylibacter xiamenensis TaxID=1524460 RepID=UPI0024A7A5E6